MSYAPQPTDGDDIIVGDDADDLINALEGNDTVLAGGGNDSIAGGGGDDDLQGQEGDDTLVTNRFSGNDRLAGGPGDDLYLVERDATIVEAPGEGNDTVRYRDDTFTGTVLVPANVETLVLVGRFNDITAEGNGQDNAIYGNNTGDDTLSGGGGDDYLQGDFAFYYGSNSFASSAGDDVIHGGDGDDEIWGDQGDLNSDGGNDTLYGDAGNDSLHGQGGDNQLFGGEGDDLLEGGSVMDGGSGNDTYLFGRNAGSQAIVEVGAAGETNIVELEAGVLPSDVAVWREGNDLVLSIVGYQDNRLAVLGYFSASHPPLAEVRFSNGTVWGASVFAAAPGGAPGDEDLFIRGTPGVDFLAGRGGNDTIDGLENDDTIEGAGGNDYLLGGPGRDNLLGGPGDDWLDGGIDNDVLLGGEGQDTLVGDEGTDFFNSGPGNDLVDGGTGFSILEFEQGDGHDRFRGASGTGSEVRLSFYYNEVPDAPQRGLLASEAALSRTGDDLLISIRGGADSITIEDYFLQEGQGLYPLGWIQFYDETWDNAAIAARVQPAAPPPITGTEAGETLVGTGTDDVVLAGGGDDLLEGGEGDDFLNGELGDDVLRGGPGNDMLVVDSADDSVRELAGQGTDTVQSYIDYQLGRNVENLILIGDFAHTGIGNALDNVLIGNALDNALWGRRGDDVLYGNAGHDFLNGGAGDDQMYGGWGDDQVVVDRPGDVIWEAAGEGTDTVQSYIDFALPDNFEILVLIGDAGRTALGNAQDNLIAANDSGVFMDGRGGSDALFGGRGDDTAVVHDGNEIVDLGPGQDTLRFGPALTFLDLQGKAGFSLQNLETIGLDGDGSAGTLRLAPADVLALRPEGGVLRVLGDGGDTLEIGAGWSGAPAMEAGYVRYEQSVGGELAVLLVDQDMAVSTQPFLT